MPEITVLLKQRKEPATAGFFRANLCLLNPATVNLHQLDVVTTKLRTSCSAALLDWAPVPCRFREPKIVGPRLYTDEASERQMPALITLSTNEASWFLRQAPSLPGT